MEDSLVDDPKASSKSRRDFIAQCGRFAVVTPPAITVMLSTAGRNYAQAFSGLQYDDSEYKKDDDSR
jgi:hypothetical protein